jgi:hypothetical protein
MKLTEIERTIIVINIIGVILDEYSDDESTSPIKTLKEKCIKFSRKQSGTEERFVSRSSLMKRVVIVNSKRHNRYVNTSMIGDKIWRDAIDHFSKQKLKIDAVTLIEAIYLFHEKIIGKHTTIKRHDIDAFRFENEIVDDKTALDGTAVGGHLMGLLARESGENVNGKLRAFRLKKEDEMGRAA